MINAVALYPDNFEQLVEKYKRKKEAGANIKLWLQDTIQRLYRLGYNGSLTTEILKRMLEEKLKWLN